RAIEPVDLGQLRLGQKRPDALVSLEGAREQGRRLHALDRRVRVMIDRTLRGLEDDERLTLRAMLRERVEDLARGERPRERRQRAEREDEARGRRGERQRSMPRGAEPGREAERELRERDDRRDR